MSKGRYGTSMTVEYAPWYGQKRKRRKLTKEQRRARAERPPVECDVIAGVCPRRSAAQRDQERAER